MYHRPASLDKYPMYARMFEPKIISIMNKNQVKEDTKIVNSEVNRRNTVFLALADSLLSSLDKRSQEIIRKRYGLVNGQEETLEKIGRHYNITRERIRQIISEALKNISAKLNHEDFLKAEEKIIFTIDKNNGIIKKSEVIEKFNSNGQGEANAIKFFINCSKKIFEVEEKEIFEKTWVISEEVLNDVKKVILEAEKIISGENKLFSDEKISEKLVSVLPHIPKDRSMNFLKMASRIKKNKFGKWGMIDWMEVSPKGTRERVYLVLKEKKKPLHFIEIAELIDKFKLGKKKAHPQTVHNELIKDNRFVLIGRGIYALREHGYFEGTIREVIKDILEKRKEPMSKEEIMTEVLKIRKVKKTTIMINLNNKNFFQKKGDLYSVKK